MASGTGTWGGVLSHSCHILGISFEKSVIEMRPLKAFLKDKRNDLVEEALKFSKDTCEEIGISVVKRRIARRKKIMPGEKAADEPLTLDQELKGQC
ncbi:hypothetical protein AVEN_120571-1 [Araneus ventricosus]|uniref:Uncharacterized protein n=1 Tax=Araneus ventricosus TaxID=182803 RepID=A0A4Y2H9J7_ARAVE|nr:hypothetical protein AVEN_120571-1 [Araneus ventricosus]